MKKIQYQNYLREIFNLQKEKECNRKPDKKEKINNSLLLHLDWACKLSDVRLNFLPDFETLEKKNFSNIRMLTSSP